MAGRQAVVYVQDGGRDTSWQCAPCWEGAWGFGRDHQAAQREAKLHNLLRHAPAPVQLAAAVLEAQLGGLVSPAELRAAMLAVHWWEAGA